MDVTFVRICAVPALPPGIVDGLREVAVSFGALTSLVPADPDLRCTVLELRAGDVEGTLRSTAAVLRESARDRLLSFEVQGGAAADAARERSLAEGLSDWLNVPVYVARRDVPASAWVDQRPMSFGVDGFAIRAASPTVARAQSRGRGASLEFGAPSILMKLGLHDVPGFALRRLRDAIGSARGGLLHLGAYPAISAATGQPVMLIECSDPAKSPLARGIELLQIEAARYGGAVGQAVLLSHIPLEALLGTLGSRMHVPVQPAQIIETHVTS